jgi:hypothetical protein
VDVPCRRIAITSPCEAGLQQAAAASGCYTTSTVRGALTCDPGMLGDGRLAQPVETGPVPPLVRLLDTPTDAPAA